MKRAKTQARAANEPRAKCIKKTAQAGAPPAQGSPSSKPRAKKLLVELPPRAHRKGLKATTVSMSPTVAASSPVATVEVVATESTVEVVPGDGASMPQIAQHTAPPTDTDGKSTYKPLDIRIIRRDMQMRTAMSQETIETYAELQARGIKLPRPIVYLHGDGTYTLVDGYHTCAAFERNGIFDVECEVRAGTRREALLFACGRNSDHGLARTNADKRRVVETLLGDPEWQRWSDAIIGKQCETSDRYVSKVRAEMGITAVVRIGADGRERNVSRIGQVAPSPTPNGSELSEPEEGDPTAAELHAEDPVDGAGADGDGDETQQREQAAEPATAGTGGGVESMEGDGAETQQRDQAAEPATAGTGAERVKDARDPREHDDGHDEPIASGPEPDAEQALEHLRKTTARVRATYSHIPRRVLAGLLQPHMENALGIKGGRRLETNHLREQDALYLRLAGSVEYAESAGLSFAADVRHAKQMQRVGPRHGTLTLDHLQHVEALVQTRCESRGEAPPWATPPETKTDTAADEPAEPNEGAAS